MTAQEYIQDQFINSAHYALTDEDKVFLAAHGIEAYIYKKLTSKKFRKYAMEESSEKQIKHAITLHVTSNKPLQFRYPFGGYKLWSLPSAPEIDWAEFFSIAYYIKYLAPLAAAYKPGLELIFASDDVIIERMDNVPKQDTDAYFNSFKKLLELFRRYVPDNMKIDIIRIGDLYEDKEAMELELAENLARVQSEYDSFDQVAERNLRKSSELNIQWKGLKDLTGLSESEKQKVIAMGPVYHHAYTSLSKRRAFNRGEDKILIFTTVVPNSIAVGTTKTSITKFWTGVGVLETDKDSFKARILSPSQLEKLKQENVEEVPMDILDLKNFKTLMLASNLF